MTQEMAVWRNALPLIEEELSPASYNGFITDLKPVLLRNNTLYLQSPSEFKRSHLRERYTTTIINAVHRGSGRNYTVEFVLDGELNQMMQPVSESHPITLNPRYTFETFVIGESNHFAHAAANVVANNPGKSYNPLFIYGGVGLGKTHLMHAIGNQISADNPDARIMYVTSEKFTNEMIAAIRGDKNEEFRTRYRNVDVLMVDDIQFISNKEGTQVEFFNTFNHLYDEKKQLIISSDKPPKEIPTLEDRLRSRFEWGLLADVKAPDYETRVAILQKKAELENLIVPQEVLNFIAEKVKSNIRELEGSLTRVIAYSNLLGLSISVSLAAEALKDFITPGENEPISIDKIKEVVSDYYKISVEVIDGKKRNRDIAFPRQIAMYLCRELTDLSTLKIGEAFGGRDHTTIMHGCEKISGEMKSDPRLKTTIEDLTKRLME